MSDFERTKALAEQGDANAQINLGVMYYNGDGVKQDKTEALKWVAKAAEQGLACAQYNLGVMYENGQGVEKDYTKAVSWYKKAAVQGVAIGGYWVDCLSRCMVEENLSSLATPTKPKSGFTRDLTLDFTGKSRLDLLSNLAKEINDVVLSYDGAITLAEAIGVLEIAKIELYNNQAVTSKPTKDN